MTARAAVAGRTRARRTLAAVVLAGLAPPGGHVFLGRPLRGLVLLLLALLASLAWVLLATSSLALAEVAAFPALLLVLAIIVDAGVLAARSPEELPPRPLHRWWIYVGLAVLTQLVLPDALYRFLRSRAGIVDQEDDAMIPTVLPGERVVYRRRSGGGFRPARGDLVVLATESCGACIRLVVGLPGEEIGLDRGTVTVNGSWSLDDRLRRARRRESSLEPVRLSESQVYVLGDRRLPGAVLQGPVELDRLLGRPTYVLFPAGFPTDLDLAARLGAELR